MASPRGPAADGGDRGAAREPVRAEPGPGLEAHQGGPAARSEAPVEPSGREAARGEQPLERRDVPARGARPDDAAAEPRAPAPAERRTRPRADDAVRYEAVPRLQAPYRLPRHRPADAVDRAAVGVVRA